MGSSAGNRKPPDIQTRWRRRFSGHAASSNLQQTYINRTGRHPSRTADVNTLVVEIAIVELVDRNPANYHLRASCDGARQFDRLRISSHRSCTTGSRSVGLPTGVGAGTAVRPNVHIECLDWADFIRRYDRPFMLFYVDPPYWGHETDYGSRTRPNGYRRRSGRRSLGAHARSGGRVRRSRRRLFGFARGGRRALAMERFCAGGRVHRSCRALVDHCNNVGRASGVVGYARVCVESAGTRGVGTGLSAAWLIPTLRTRTSPLGICS